MVSGRMSDPLDHCNHMNEHKGNVVRQRACVCYSHTSSSRPGDFYLQCRAKLVDYHPGRKDFGVGIGWEAMVTPIRESKFQLSTGYDVDRVRFVVELPTNDGFVFSLHQSGFAFGW